MKQNEKTAATNSGFNTNLNHTITVNKYTSNQSKLQQQRLSDEELEQMQRREMLENSRLSRLPKLPSRTSFLSNDAPAPVIVAVCAGCGGRLDIDDQIQITFTGCRKCLAIYGRIDAAFDENAKRKKKEMLQKMLGGVK